MPNNDVSVVSNELSLNGEWQFCQKGHEKWLPARVPGCNFTDLLNNELIEDPFYRDHESQLQWIEKEDWHYRKNFTVTQELLSHSEVELVMEGLDTYCSVYLNGTLIHESNNMFVGYRIACKAWLVLGNNELRVEFRSPINEVMPTFINNGFSYPAENDKSVERLSVLTRKAPYHYGWDWGPRFVTSGIWRNICLRGVNKARFDDVYLQQTRLSLQRAELSLHLNLTRYQAFDGAIEIRCLNVAGISQKIALDTGSSDSEFTVPLIIENPKLWWPNGMGEPFLHQFSITLFDGEQAIDSQSLDIGLRTIEVVNQADEHGESFFVKVNGHATFMKGANYIPSDSFLPRVDSEKYQKIFQDAVAANMNMLRVWGGGIYENDEFYHLADRHGILIWQDFMFACSLYPGDASFINNVKQEAIYNIKRLRNHACLALWCGNNETEMGIAFWQWPEKFDYSDELYQQLQRDYQHLFKSVLPQLVTELDPQRFYFSSSPIGFWEKKEDDNRGDNHYWGVWHGEEPFSEFKNRVPRFMSEFGFQSFPLMDSVKRYSNADDWQLSSKVMKTHQKHPRGNSLIKQYMQSEYREPKDFNYFLYLSQIQQALGMKVAFEAHRAAMPFCMGSLYWQFNDCWPVASWSGIDYYGQWKALHYQAKRSFSTLALFVDDHHGSLVLNLVSDALNKEYCLLELSLQTLDGELLWSQQETLEVKQQMVTSLPLTAVESLLSELDSQNIVLYARLCHNNELGSNISEAFHYFVPTKALGLQLPVYSYHSHYQNEQLTISLTTNTLARGVYVSLSNMTGNFSDNFFDLLPGVEKQITLKVGKLTDEELSALVETMTIISIADSYQ